MHFSSSRRMQCILIFVLLGGKKTRVKTVNLTEAVNWRLYYSVTRRRDSVYGRTHEKIVVQFSARHCFSKGPKSALRSTQPRIHSRVMRSRLRMSGVIHPFPPSHMLSCRARRYRCPLPYSLDFSICRSFSLVCVCA